MAENIFKTLAARNEFIGHLEADIGKTNLILEETKVELNKLKELTENIKTFGKYPEHTSFIPLAKNIYMKGKIVHTGEYYVTKPAYPEPYILLQSLEQTLNSLEDGIKLKNSELEKTQYANYQLTERIKILRGDLEDDLSETDADLPKEIKSEKGVAVKLGEFYEILEFEEDE